MVQVILVLSVIGYLELVHCAYSDTSETREILHLDGVWNCYCERDNKPLEYREQYGLRKLDGIVKMPVPGSLIDFAAQMDSKICPGVVWYERSFFVPKSWKYDRKIMLRLDGLASYTGVWINRENVETGNKNYVELDVTEKLIYDSENSEFSIFMNRYLPLLTDLMFNWINGENIETGNKNYVELDVTEKLIYDSENTVALEVKKIFKNHIQIPRVPQSISLRSVPEILYIQSVSVGSTVANGTAFITYKAQAGGLLRLSPKCISVQVLDKDNTQVAFNKAGNSLEGHFSIPDCHFWWPLCMDSRAGYLYTLVFKLYYKYCESEVKDVYRMKLGIRPLHWSNSSLTINDKSFYLQGVEGSDEWARKPFSPSTDLKDITLLKWLNANALVTNVAPSEETLDLADELGLFVILGSPKSSLEGVIIRYRHHPSVIMWSFSEGDDCISSECRTLNDSFIDRVRFLDSTRPFTAKFPLSTAESSEMVSKLDIISLSLEKTNLGNGSLLQNTIERLKKPVIIMYGDKFLPTTNRIRTLNFNLFPEVNDGFDNIKRDTSMVGEFYGNFIAYECLKDEGLTLVDGIFNRNREPTTGAEIVRSKFRPKRSVCPHRTPRCRFNKSPRKRMLK